MIGAECAGVVAATYAYDAYGNPTASTGNVYNPLRYAGEYLDAQTGFYYLRARYYDPSTQQFLTPDPLVAATEQAYTYATGSPLNFIDPSGKTAIAIPIGIGVVACGPLCWAALGGAVTGVVLYLVITKLIQDYNRSQVCSATEPKPWQEAPRQKDRSIHGKPTDKDITMPDEDAALRETLRRYRAPSPEDNTIERGPDTEGGPGTKGKYGQPSDTITFLDDDGEIKETAHHKWGHIFDDEHPGEIPPHYHGPDGEHIKYPWPWYVIRFRLGGARVPMQFYTGPVSAKQAELLLGIQREAEWSLWVLAEGRYLESADLLSLARAVGDLRGIVWNAAGVAFGLLRGRVRDQGSAFGNWPKLNRNLVAESVTRFEAPANHVYSGVAWVGSDDYEELAKLLARSTAGKDSTLAFIPNTDDAANDWTTIVYGLSWLWHCQNWRARDTPQTLRAHAVVLSYIGLTIKIGGVAGLVVENLDAKEGDPKGGLVLYGDKALLAPVAGQLAAEFEVMDEDHFARWFRRGVRLKAL